MTRWWLALLPLAACDVAPRPLDLERSIIETPDEGYQVFADTITAGSIARSIAENCNAYRLDEPARRRQWQFFEDEMERLAVDDPETMEAIHRRVGVNVSAAQVVANGGYQGLTAPQVNAGFLLRNPGLTVDIGTRAIGGIARNGVEPTCEDAEREIAEGTMAGSFLRPVPDIIESAETAPLPLPEFEPVEGDPAVDDTPLKTSLEN